MLGTLPFTSLNTRLQVGSANFSLKPAVQSIGLFVTVSWPHLSFVVHAPPSNSATSVTGLPSSIKLSQSLSNASQTSVDETHFPTAGSLSLPSRTKPPGYAPVQEIYPSWSKSVQPLGNAVQACAHGSFVSVVLKHDWPVWL